ncbi:O-antigen translocase [Flavobacteriaceae bacterium XHP0103]|nr:O-antigen translocase [Marixanthotalea marina]
MLFRFVFRFISQKILAVYLGPQGLALYGNLNNAILMLASFTILGTDQGIIKYVAELKGKKEKLNLFVTTAFSLVIIGTLLSSVISFVGAKYWSQLLFNTEMYSWVFRVLSVTVPFLSFFVFCQAIINGHSDYKRMTKITVLSSFLSVLITAVLTVTYNLEGALMALILMPFFQFVSVFITGKNLFSRVWLKPTFNKYFKSKLLLFMLMATVPVLLGNIVEIKVRNYMMVNLGVLNSGHWTGMVNLSTYYFSILAGVLSVYVLPRFSVIDTVKDFKNELLKIYKIVLPLFGLGFVIVYLLRFTIISLLFSKAFLPMEVLFKWQLLGDFIKLISIILGYHILAKQLWKSFFIVEIASIVLFYLLSIFCVKKYGFEGISIAHFLRYCIYLTMVLFALKSWIFNKKANV